MHTDTCAAPPHVTLRGIIALAALSASGSVSAQSITYGPAATSIPSLGGVALILLAAFMIFVFWRMNRNSNFPGGRLMALAIFSGALASGVGGMKLVSDAVAIPSVVGFLQFSNPSGGTVSLVSDSKSAPDFYCLRNSSGVSLRIIRMTDAEGAGGCEAAAPTSIGSVGLVTQAIDELPECIEGLIMPPGGGCGAAIVIDSDTESDIRLKTDITPAGIAHNGLPLYEFRYLDGTTRYRGVMAQDVLQHTPEAVVMRADGYMHAIPHNSLVINPLSEALLE